MKKQSHHSNSVKWLMLTVLVCVTLWLRFVWSGIIPANINPDESDTLRTYLEFMQDSSQAWLRPNWNGAPMVNAVLIGGLWELTGSTYAGVYYAMGLVSALVVVIFYLLAVKVTRAPAISWLLAISLAADAWFLHFSRSAWENIAVAIPSLLVMAVPWVGQRWKISVYSLAIILGVFGYHTGKIVAIVAAIGVVIEVIRQLKQGQRQILTWPNLSLLLAIFFGAMQLKAVLIDYRVQTLSRINNVSVFAYDGASDAVWENAQRLVTGFIIFDRGAFEFGLNGRYLPNAQFVIPVWLVPFYWLGMVVFVKRKPQLVLCYWLMLVPVQIFSRGTPDAARAVHLLPIIYLFAVVGLTQVWQQLSKMRPILGRGWVMVILIVTLVSAIHQYNRYLIWIQSPITLSQRHPSVERVDYADWLAAQRESLEQSGISFSAGEWQVLLDQ